MSSASASQRRFSSAPVDLPTARFRNHPERSLSRSLPSRSHADPLGAGERELAAIHITAHGAPGRIDFTAGGWSAETLAENADDLAQLRTGGHF
jgi:hypothetical protein